MTSNRNSNSPVPISHFMERLSTSEKTKRVTQKNVIKIKVVGQFSLVVGQKVVGQTTFSDSL